MWKSYDNSLHTYGTVRTTQAAGGHRRNKDCLQCWRSKVLYDTIVLFNVLQQGQHCIFAPQTTRIEPCLALQGANSASAPAPDKIRKRQCVAERHGILRPYRDLEPESCPRIMWPVWVSVASRPGNAMQALYGMMALRTPRGTMFS